MSLRVVMIAARNPSMGTAVGLIDSDLSHGLVTWFGVLGRADRKGVARS